jgi:hypothetical protein
LFELSQRFEVARRRDTTALGWDFYISAGVDLLMRFSIGFVPAWPIPQLQLPSHDET